MLDKANQEIRRHLVKSSCFYAVSVISNIIKLKTLMMNRAPATEQVSESNRHHIVSLGPVHPDADFPVSGQRNLKFQSSWFAREEYKQWLEYSQSKDAAFCFIYRCFGPWVILCI